MEAGKMAQSPVKNISELVKLYPERGRTRATVPIRRYESYSEPMKRMVSQKVLIIVGTAFGLLMCVFFSCVILVE